MMPAGVPASSERSGVLPGSTAAAMAVQGLIDTDPDMDDSITDGRKAKRELSQSKRAAQNRAAQRAFRQRKEHYIKKLEQQVREYGDLEHNYKVIQNDNYALREYVIQLQSRLLDLQAEVPQPPPNMNLPPPSAPSTSAASSSVAEAPPSTSSAGTLADVAAAVAGLRARDPSNEELYARSAAKADQPLETSRSVDEIRRLHQEALPGASLRA